jgi:hypothetical protein
MPVNICRTASLIEPFLYLATYTPAYWGSILEGMIYAISKSRNIALESLPLRMLPSRLNHVTRHGERAYDRSKTERVRDAG